MRFASWTVLVTALTGNIAHAAGSVGPSPGFAELNASVGIAFPLGYVSGSPDLPPSPATTRPVLVSDVIQLAVPFGLQVGYRFAGLLTVGATFAYGAFGSPTGGVASCSGTGCHSYFFRTGATLQWHVLGSGASDPYLGIGFGYEWLNSNISTGTGSRSIGYHGFTWLEVPVGWDFAVGAHERLGPFASFSLGQYNDVSIDGASSSIQYKTVHFWIGFGLRFTLLIG